MYLAVHVGQHGVDRTLVYLGDPLKNSPIDLFQSQTSGKSIQAHRAGQRLGQAHIEVRLERIDPFLARPARPTPCAIHP
ncbi:hypothetical protein D3C80_1586850 [compost metagenome]